MTRAILPPFTLTDRILLIAPHPDDETIAAAALLIRAIAAGASVRILYLTDGDNNPWMQRLLEKRLRVGMSDRLRYANLRIGEVLVGLQRLGVFEQDVVFLHHPDQGLTDILLKSPQRLVAGILRELNYWRPTIVVAPSLSDRHPDHNASAVALRIGLSALPAQLCPKTILSYLNHGRGDSQRDLSVSRIELTNSERHIKRAVLSCHESQLAFRRRWFLSFASETEEFILNEQFGTQSNDDPVVSSVRAGTRTLWIKTSQPKNVLASGKSILQILAIRKGRVLVSACADLDWNREASPLRSLLDGKLLAQLRLLRHAGARSSCGYALIPIETLEDAEIVYVKAGRRVPFFDQGGWREICSEKPIRPPGRSLNICAVIPCYNVASVCGPVLRETLSRVDHLIAIDDGSTDNTGQVLRNLVAHNEGRVTVISLPENCGKGVALIEGFRRALESARFDLLVTLDGDGQHRPLDIPSLADAYEDGAEFIIGERRESERMPFRSRIGNAFTRWILRGIFPGCPFDTQSGFRAMDRRLVQKVVSSVEGRRYETELQILLFALRNGVRMTTISIPTIYFDGNRASHFHPLKDSIRVFRVLLKSVFAKLALNG